MTSRRLNALARRRRPSIRQPRRTLLAFRALAGLQPGRQRSYPA